MHIACFVCLVQMQVSDKPKPAVASQFETGFGTQEQSSLLNALSLAAEGLADLLLASKSPKAVMRGLAQYLPELARPDVTRGTWDDSTMRALLQHALITLALITASTDNYVSFLVREMGTYLVAMGLGGEDVGLPLVEMRARLARLAYQAMEPLMHPSGFSGFRATQLQNGLQQCCMGMTKTVVDSLGKLGEQRRVRDAAAHLMMNAMQVSSLPCTFSCKGTLCLAVNIICEVFHVCLCSKVKAASQRPQLACGVVQALACCIWCLPCSWYYCTSPSTRRRHQDVRLSAHHTWARSGIHTPWRCL